MANAFLSETDTAVGTSAATIYTCPASTETTVIGLSIANIVSSQILVSVKLNGAGRTSGAVDNGTGRHNHCGIRYSFIC